MFNHVMLACSARIEVQIMGSSLNIYHMAHRINVHLLGLRLLHCRTQQHDLRYTIYPAYLSRDAVTEATDTSQATTARTLGQVCLRCAGDVRFADDNHSAVNDRVIVSG